MNRRLLMEMKNILDPISLLFVFSKKPKLRAFYSRDQGTVKGPKRKKLYEKTNTRDNRFQQNLIYCPETIKIRCFYGYSTRLLFCRIKIGNAGLLSTCFGRL